MTQDEILTKKNEQYTIIANAENALAAVDYRDHKNHEALLDFLMKKYPTLKAALPYNPDELHAANNAARAEINAAQAEIARLDALVPEDVEPEPETEAGEEA